METTQTLALLAAIEACGNAVGLARACGVSPQAVTNWKRKGRVPVLRAVSVETATGGAITRYQLRPDVFGRTPKHAPARGRMR